MTVLVVDGNSIFNRAFYGIRPLTTKDGQFTNAIYGFLTMLERIKADTKPDRVAIAFDLKAPTFRHKAYAGYKAQRKGMPEELAQQLAPLKELLTLLGYKLVTCEGYEADDILGTFAKVCSESGNQCVIATGDRDSLQLVNEAVTVRLASTKEAILYTADKIKEDYGVEPKQLIDIKAIQGDSSDNIPGVQGIGQKGAGELIQKFGSLDYIYENIDTIDIKPAMRTKLVNGKDSAYMSRMLGEICTTVPVNTDLDHYGITPVDTEAAVRLMAKLELFSMIDKLGLRELPPMEDVSTQEKQEIAFETVENINEFLTKYKTKPVVFMPVFTDAVLQEIAVIENCKVYLVQGEDHIKLFLEQSKISKKTYNSKALYGYCHKHNIHVGNITFDCMLAAYLLNPSASGYDLGRLYQEYAIDVPPVDDGTYAYVKEYVALDKLTEKLEQEIIGNQQENLLTDIEIPLAKVLAEMENIGFAVDRNGIEHYGNVLGEQIAVLEQDIYSSVGYEFNINSPKQLGAALFEKLGLPAKKKTKSGYSTNAEVLEGLYHYHPVIPMILNYRSLAKLKSTYCDGLLKVISDDGRIHTSFNQTETRTGRISSTEPNLQNIPVRTELGKELRKFFSAKDGWLLVDADYSQIELRVLAHISGDTNMVQAFKDNEDIHTITASQVFNMPLDLVTSVMRSRAKAVNFGIVYGIGAFSLSKDIGVTNKEASNYIKSYLAHYSGVDAYMKNIVEKAKADGYVETMFGRRRYLPELTAGNHITRSFGERVARNMPIQGTAADIIKIAMVKVSKRLEEENMHARLILQVHDELIVESPQDEAIRVAMILQEEMENAVSLSVPLPAEASMGQTWYDAKE